jgi:hypothetical protein
MLLFYLKTKSKLRSGVIFYRKNDTVIENIDSDLVYWTLLF